ncbi:MAG: Rrf2 family transcriptional regulator [Acidobacteriota bacterium]|jgi:Rrf2 family protein|nr:Rrf2 family transcriptional regulator [Acidobacteriota bacterium]
MASNSQFAIAVHILTMLAKDSDVMLKSEYIAESVNTNAVVIRRLLCDLQNADLVVSQKGATGGTRLAKKAENIKLNDVYEAVSHGEVFSLHRQKPNQDCPVGKNIEAVLCNLQKDIGQVIEAKLVQYSLSDVIEFVEEEKGILTNE